MNQVRHMLAICIALCAVSEFPATSLSAEEIPATPNVLMIAVDDLSDYVSILQNHPGIKTPNFDRLAKRSVNFTRAYCAAPICNPSRVAIMTGLAPHHTGVYQLGDRLSRSKPALAAIALEENFKRHGYNTYLTGKYYHANEDHWLPKARLDAAWTQRLAPFSNHEPKHGPNRIIGGGILSIGPASIGVESMPDTAIVNNTRAWLSQKHDKPFLIVHGINKPHLSFVVPQSFFDLYPLESLVLPETPHDDFDDIPESVKQTFLKRGDRKKFAQIRKTKNGWKEVMQAYLASISFCDWVLGEILDALDASPYADNTIVVLWSDHGYHIGEKEWLHKRALWTQTTRVPFLISVPGMDTAGENCAAPVSLLDIYPTLCELCHLDQAVPQLLAGHSVTPLLKNPSQDWPHVAVTSHGEGNAATIDARYHYIQYADGSEELYDHQTDPREYNNLAHQPDLNSVIKRLAESIPKSWIPENTGLRKRTTESQSDSEE
ncbi:sulfatase [Stieleria varia]|uniref:Choline-sulfatase n=1 Tax=Stieleria varia TaxID=2528005 RepID=A0A5C6ART3_9BACT|nr:sulfatase [Stieleria varia]TWU02211.1 Choline-sulfatase [Stieleria varia]